MPSNNFRREAKNEIVRLLKYWRIIELGIKRAEQISDSAVVPAINELRYAGRQLFNAMRVYGKATLTPGDVNVIKRRLIIAEQYFLNADHDTLDAIISFYRRWIKDLLQEFGDTEIIVHFNEFPLLRKSVQECDNLIAETRLDYDKRQEHYDKIRNEYLDGLVNNFRRLEDAEVSARYVRRTLENELQRKQYAINILSIIALIGSVCSIVSIPLAVYFYFASG